MPQKEATSSTALDLFSDLPQHVISFFQLREDLEKEGMILVNFAAHLRELHEYKGGPLEILGRIEAQHWAFAHLF